MADRKAFPLYAMVSLILAAGLCLIAYFLLGFPLVMSILLGVGLGIVALFIYVVYQSIGEGRLIAVSKTRSTPTRLTSKYKPVSNPYLHRIEKPSQAVEAPTVSQALWLSENDSKVSLIDNPRVEFPLPQPSAVRGEPVDSSITPKRKSRIVLSKDQGLSRIHPHSSLADDLETKGVVLSNEAQAFHADLNEEDEEEDDAVLRAAKAMSLAQPDAPKIPSTAISAQRLPRPFHDTMFMGGADGRIQSPYQHPLLANSMENKRGFSSEDPVCFLTQADVDAVDQPPFSTTADADAFALAVQMQYWEIEEASFSETRPASHSDVAQAIHSADFSEGDDEKEDAELESAKAMSLTRSDDQAVGAEDIKKQFVNISESPVRQPFYEETMPPVESKLALPETPPPVKRYLEAHSRGLYQHNPTRLLHVIQEAKDIDDIGEEEIGIVVKRAIELGANVSAETMAEWDDETETMKAYDALDMANKRGYRGVVDIISEETAKQQRALLS